MSLEKFKEKVAACQNCPLSKTRDRVAMGRGTFSSKILFLGEAPNYNDDREGEAFTGNVGEILNDALKFGGFDGINPIPYYLDNMVHCCPPENRKPEVAEVDACWPWTSELIGAMNPKIIIPMGETAIQGLARKYGFRKVIGTKKIQELIGRVIVLDNGTVVVPAYNPAFVARRNNLKEDYKIFFSFLAQSYPNWLKVRGKVPA